MNSSNFPTTAGAYDTTKNPLTNMFVTKLAPLPSSGTAPAAYDEAYAYDTVGNFTSKAGVAYTGYGAGAGGSGHAHAPATVGGQAYAYDANGNVTGGGGRTSVWDANNQPTSIVGPDGVTETYGYDADGTRVSRTRAGVTTVYLGGAWEQDVQSGASTKTRAFMILQGRAVAQRERVASPASDATIYLHGDHLGGVSAATSATGALLSRQSFTPWGELRAGGGDVTQTTRDFTGQLKDDTGLLFYNARYFDPKLGRFASADSIVPGSASGKGGMAATLGPDGGTALRPLTVDFHEPAFASGVAEEDAFTQEKGFWFQLKDEDRQKDEGAKWLWGPQNPQALDRYAYVLNNPLRYTDPTGHFIIAIPAAVAALFTAEVLTYVVAAFIVVSFVNAVITCSQDPGCSSVLPAFANQLNQGAISVQQFLGEVQQSLAKKADIQFVDQLVRDYNLSKKQRKELHNIITKQHYTEEEIEVEAKEIADRDGNEYQPRRR